jgi:hypothetical protein
MAKNSITQYDTTAASNTDVGNIPIEGSDNVANFDNALREIMKHLADMNAGDSPLHDTFVLVDADEESKGLKFDLSNITASNTRTLTAPDTDIDLSTIAVKTITDWHNITKSGNYVGSNITNNPNSVSSLTGNFTARAIFTSDGLYGVIEGYYLSETTPKPFRKFVNNGTYGDWSGEVALDKILAGEVISDKISDGTTEIDTGYVVNGSAKAWCNFSQNNATVRDSMNISSVTDDSQGVSTIYFTTDFDAANYSFIGTNKDGNTKALNPSLGATTADTYTVSAFQYYASHNTVLNDGSFTFTACFGVLST